MSGEKNRSVEKLSLKDEKKAYKTSNDSRNIKQWMDTEIDCSLMFVSTK